MQAWTVHNAACALLASESKLIEDAAMLVRIKYCTFLKLCLDFSRAIWRRVWAQAWKCSLSVQHASKEGRQHVSAHKLKEAFQHVCVYLSVCACVWLVFPCTFTGGLSARLTGWTCYSELVRERFSTRTFVLHVLVVTSLRSTSYLSKPVKFSVAPNQRRSVVTAAFRARIIDSAVCGEVVGIISVPLSSKIQTHLCPQAQYLNIIDEATLLQNPESLPQPDDIGGLFPSACISVNKTQMWEQYLPFCCVPERQPRCS